MPFLLSDRCWYFDLWFFYCWIFLNPTGTFKSSRFEGRSQDGGGVGLGEHFLPHKFIKRAFKRRVNSTIQLMNAARGHQAPRKEPNSWKVGRKKYKRQKKDKRGREGFPSREDSLKKRKVSKHQESFSLPNLCQALEAQRAT